MFKKLQLVILAVFLNLNINLQAADIAGLTSLFQDNFNYLYQPRFCGRNIGNFIKLAQKHKIDLSNSYVMKFVGSGFLHTSGFYTRTKPNEREMLGYFHMVLVADNYVFDFDLNEPLVLRMPDYIRLQFAPPYEPFRIWGIDYRTEKDLAFWKLTAFETQAYALGSEVELWNKLMRDFIDLKRLKDRIRPR
jgi:hypothetical protein